MTDRKQTAILGLYDDQMRHHRHAGPGQRIDFSNHCTRVLGDVPGGEYGAVIYSRLDATDADPAIAEQIRFFTAQGRPFEWKLFGHDQPIDLGERLVRFGFRQGDRETLLVAEPTPLAVPVPEGITIRQLTTSADLDFLAQFDELSGRELNRPLLTELRLELESSPPAVSIYVAMAGQKPVSRGWIRYYPKRDFADLWGAETLPEFRRRGIYRCLIAARWEEARRRGVRYLTTDALPTSRPILEKLGFRPLSWTAPYLYLTDLTPPPPLPRD
jgi:GNAT superfamily N-acetyltransferase